MAAAPSAIIADTFEPSLAAEKGEAPSVPRDDRETVRGPSKPCLNQLSTDDASRAVMPTVDAVAGDKGEPDDTETQGELNEGFNHRTHGPHSPILRG